MLELRTSPLSGQTALNSLLHRPKLAACHSRAALGDTGGPGNTLCELRLSTKNGESHDYTDNSHARTGRPRGFDVKVLDRQGNAVNPKTNGFAHYNFDRKSKSFMTVSEWKQRRFSPTYPGYSCRVLNGDGSEAYGNAKLVSVRESYEE